MKTVQRGFTLIELVVVIVILGILAATALPKFVDLSTEAGNAAANGVAGALASSSAINYAAQVAGKTTPPPLTGLNVANVCTHTILQPFVSGVVLSTGTTNTSGSSAYAVSAGAGSCQATPTGVGPGGSVTCNIIGQHGAAQTATIICGNS